jgi:hypothetical protein
LVAEKVLRKEKEKKVSELMLFYVSSVSRKFPFSLVTVIKIRVLINSFSFLSHFSAAKRFRIMSTLICLNFSKLYFVVLQGIVFDGYGLFSYLNVCWLMIWIGKVCNRVICSRNYGAKDIGFGIGARAAMLQGVSEVADAVKVTMGPKVLGPVFVNFSLCLWFLEFVGDL